VLLPRLLYTGVCKHLGAVARRAAREGWAFGAIAPLATVARYMPLDPPCPDPDPEPEPTPPAGGAALSSVAAVQARGRAALADLFDEAA